MDAVKIELTGISPLLMHRFPLEDIDPPLEKRTPEDQAEIAAYRTPDGELYIPAEALRQALIRAAVYSKGKGRASLQKPVAACIAIEPEYLILDPQEYTIDSRSVVVPSTKGRVVRHRPRFDEWRIEATIQYDPALVTEKQLRQIIDDAGSRVGVLDWRPDCKGPMGRFVVTAWSAL